MIWTEGYTARYYMTTVDPVTWKDVDKYEIKGGSISKVDTNLCESANLSLGDIPQGIERWVRIYLVATKMGSGARAPLFTGLLSCPRNLWTGRLLNREAECFSVLKPAEDILLERGWYAPAGAVGASVIKELLSVVAPVNVIGVSPKLSSNLIAENDENGLTMAYKILQSIGWRLRITGAGEIQILPKAFEALATYDNAHIDVLKPNVTDEQDLFSVPNCFRAIKDEFVAVAKDEADDSPFSIQNRGRPVWKQETDCALTSGESIAEYAMRRLKELQAPARTVSYTKRFDPETVPGDIVRIHYPQQNIDADFRITSQTITLGEGAHTEEEGVMI